MDVSSPSSPSPPSSSSSSPDGQAIASLSSASPASGDGSLSFIWASERSGFMHLYLYKYVPGADEAVEVRQITSGEWVVEFVVGVDQVRVGKLRRGTVRGLRDRPPQNEERRVGARQELHGAGEKVVAIDGE